MDDKLLNSNLNYENYDDYIEKIFNIFRLSDKENSVVLSISLKKEKCITKLKIINKFGDTKEFSDVIFKVTEEIFDTFIEKFIDDIKKNPVKNLLLLNISPTIWSKFIKKSFLEENNIEFPQNISYAEDLAAVLNIFINKPKIVCNEKRFYNYYQRNDSISNKISSKVLEIDDAIQFIKEKLVEMNIYYENKEEFEYTVFRHLLISKILRFNYLYPERKKVFQQYKARNIDINKNKYIIRDLSYGNRNLKLRINLYNLNYSIATLCDKSLGYVK